MSAVGDAVTDLLAALDAAGVPATADPDTVAPLIASRGAVAYVQPPEVESRTLSRGMRLLTGIALLGAPPGGLAQLGPVWDQLGAVMDTAAARTARLETATVGGVTYPGYRIDTITNTPC